MPWIEVDGKRYYYGPALGERLKPEGLCWTCFRPAKRKYCSSQCRYYGAIWRERGQVGQILLVNADVIAIVPLAAFEKDIAFICERLSIDVATCVRYLLVAGLKAGALERLAYVAKAK